MNIEVSIIIPVFNKEDYLGDCLDSVLGQTFRDLEVICVDDASEDKCREILQSYAIRDDRLKVIHNTENLGPAPSRNRGIESAKGRFLRFVDADDLLPQRSTEVLHSRAIRDDVEVVKGSLALFRGNDESTHQEVFSVPDKIRTHLCEEECLWIPWWHTSYLISAELVHRNQLRYPNLVRGEDPVFLASVLVNAGYLSMVEQIVYLYRRYPKTDGSGGLTMQHVMDTLKHAAMTRHLFTSHYPDCWQQGYGPFFLNKVRRLIDRCELDSDQQGVVDVELVRIWGSNALRSSN
jgi:glycosyltransferase involved in cell wall biosynthesis